MRTSRSVVVASCLALASCRSDGGPTSPQVVAGVWALDRYGGQPLPAVWMAGAAGDTTLIVADKLTFDGHGGVSRHTWFRGWTPDRQWATDSRNDGTYVVRGNEVTIYYPCGDCDPQRSGGGPGRLTAGTLTFPNNGGDSTRVYVR